MIVEPDFLTHWKTQMLIVEMNDKAAPLYVLSLWAHCQQRRKASFDVLPPNALKAICRYEGEASKLSSALERCGWIDANGEGFIVHGWAEANAKLIAQWENGGRGGRKPRDNPTGTQEEPTGNPNPKTGNPRGTDREEKSREEQIQAPSPGASADAEPGQPGNSPPTLETILAYAASMHASIPAEIATAFFDLCDSRPLAASGRWTDHQGVEIAKWQPALRKYAASWQDRNRQRSGAGNRQPERTAPDYSRPGFGKLEGTND